MSSRQLLNKFHIGEFPINASERKLMKFITVICNQYKAVDGQASDYFELSKIKRPEEICSVDSKVIFQIGGAGIGCLDATSSVAEGADLFSK